MKGTQVGDEVLISFQGITQETLQQWCDEKQLGLVIHSDNGGVFCSTKEVPRLHDELQNDAPQSLIAAFFPDDGSPTGGILWGPAENKRQKAIKQMERIRLMPTAVREYWRRLSSPPL
jgi:hypothetical protein